MSEYAVHFTKDAGADSAYNVMLKILWEGSIVASGPFGTARGLSELGDSQKAACFSEIPLDLLSRLIENRSLYGIGFYQGFLAQQGAARVWYLDKDSPAATSFQELVVRAMKGGIDPSDPLWRLTPFIDNPGEYPAGAYRFEWEREWRIPGGVRFTPADVAFLFIPEDLHDAARSFFEGHLRDHSGPSYLSPYVDPRWEMTHIQTAFAGVVAAPASLSPAEAMTEYGT